MRELFYWLIIGIISIIILDVLGSITSRLMGFKYVYLAPISFIFYTFLAFIITRDLNWRIAILVSLFLGVFDATIGWKLSIFFKANVDTSYQITLQNVFSMAFLTTIFGIIGSLIALKFSK